VDKTNKISVRINGEDTYLDRKEESKAQNEVIMAQDEQASSIEDWMEEQEKQKQEASNDSDSDSSSDNISVLERTYPVKKKRFGLTKTVKRMMAAGASAVLIGIALGYVMIRLFAGMEAPEASSSTAYQDDIDNQTASSNEEGATEPSSTPETSSTDQGEEGEAVTTEQTSMTFPNVSAFVVQAGIFSTREQAEIMQNAISEKGVKSYIWPREDEFYLFAGVAPSKAEGEQIATLLKSQEIEVYVKEWSVTGADKTVSQPEGEWVQKGIEEWQSLLSPAASLINTGTGEIGDLTNPISSWTDSAPETDAEQTASIQQSYEQFLSSVKTYESNESTASLWAIHVSLFDVWYSYEQYIQ